VTRDNNNNKNNNNNNYYYYFRHHVHRHISRDFAEENTYFLFSAKCVKAVSYEKGESFIRIY
jgi:hypothetical protein